MKYDSYTLLYIKRASQVALVVKNLPANIGEAGYESLIPGSEKSPGGEYDNPLQYSCLENPMDRGDWWAMVDRVTKLHVTEVT